MTFDPENNGGRENLYKCDEHLEEHNFECPKCDVEFTEQQQILKELVQKNESLRQQIENQGARLDPIIFMELKLRLITEIVTGNNPVFMHQFTARYHEELHRILMQAQHEVNKQKLQVAPLDMSQLKRPKQRPR